MYLNNYHCAENLRPIHQIIHSNYLIDNIIGNGRGSYLFGVPNLLISSEYNVNLIFVL